MALLAMAVHDTEENGRSKYTEKTTHSLLGTVNLFKHRLVFIDNASCQKTKDRLEWMRKMGEKWYNNSIEVITNDTNIGTAEAINLAWKTRRPGEHCIKMDNDVVIKEIDWIEQMEEAIIREPRIGQIGLKRKDLEESPDQTNRHFRSVLKMLPHKAGEKWLIVEEVNHVMGTCVMHSCYLLDQVGYLKQYGVYGFDDSIMSFRSKHAGFINCFLPSIEIDHIDTGDNPYTKEKQELAAKAWPDYQQLIKDYISGKESIYYNPFE